MMDKYTKAISELTDNLFFLILTVCLILLVGFIFATVTVLTDGLTMVPLAVLWCVAVYRKANEDG